MQQREYLFVGMFVGEGLVGDLKGIGERELWPLAVDWIIEDHGHLGYLGHLRSWFRV